MELPTVCVVNPSAKSGFTRINESDFDPKVHSIYGEAPAPAVEPDDMASLTAGKGPGGRWYVKRGKEIVSGPYPTEDAASAAAMKAG